MKHSTFYLFYFEKNANDYFVQVEREDHSNTNNFMTSLSVLGKTSFTPVGLNKIAKHFYVDLDTGNMFIFLKTV